MYYNRFCGVCAFDVTSLADHVNEYQVTFFLEELQDACADAFVILYYDGTVPGAKKLKEKILMERPFLSLKAEPYTAEESTGIILAEVAKRGIKVLDHAEVSETIRSVILMNPVRSIPEAEEVADLIATCADYSGKIPTVDAGKICDHLAHSYQITDIRRGKYAG